MALTHEEVIDHVEAIDSVKALLDILDRTDIEAISKELAETTGNLSGSGSDTSEGTEFILVVKGSKV